MDKLTKISNFGEKEMPKPPAVPSRPERHEPVIDIEVLSESRGRPPVVPSRTTLANSSKIPHNSSVQRPVERSLDLSESSKNKNFTFELASPRSRGERIGDGHSPTVGLARENTEIHNFDTTDSQPVETEPPPQSTPEFDLRAEYEKLMRGEVEDDPPDPSQDQQDFAQPPQEKSSSSSSSSSEEEELSKPRGRLGPRDIKRSTAQMILDLNLEAYGGHEKRVGRILSISDEDFTAEKIFDFEFSEPVNYTNEEKTVNEVDYAQRPSRHFTDIPFLLDEPILGHIPGIDDPLPVVESSLEVQTESRPTSTPKFDVFGDIEELSSLPDLSLLNYDDFGFGNWDSEKPKEDKPADEVKDVAPKPERTGPLDFSAFARERPSRKSSYDDYLAEYFSGFGPKPIDDLKNEPSHDSAVIGDKDIDFYESLYESYRTGQNSDNEEKKESNFEIPDWPPQDQWPPSVGDTQRSHTEERRSEPSTPKNNLSPSNSFCLQNPKKSSSSSSSSSSEPESPNLVPLQTSQPAGISSLSASKPKLIPIRAAPPSTGIIRATKPLPPPPLGATSPRSPRGAQKGVISPRTATPDAKQTATGSPTSPSASLEELGVTHTLGTEITEPLDTGKQNDTSPLHAASAPALSKPRDWPPKKVVDGDSVQPTPSLTSATRPKLLLKSHTTGSAPEPAPAQPREVPSLTRNLTDGSGSAEEAKKSSDQPSSPPPSFSLSPASENKPTPPVVPKRIDFSLQRQELQRSTFQASTGKNLSVSDGSTFIKSNVRLDGDISSSPKSAFVKTHTTGPAPKLVSLFFFCFARSLLCSSSFSLLSCLLLHSSFSQ